MEIIILLFFFLGIKFFFAIYDVVSKHFAQTHRSITGIGLIVACLSLLFGMGWLIGFFVFCFAIYTTISAFILRGNKNFQISVSHNARTIVGTLLIFLIFIFLAATFNSIATFFLASVCFCYWGVQYMFATK